MTDAPLACRLDDPGQVQQRRSLIQELRRAAQETRELPDGYAVRLPGDELWCRKLADFIAFERECCPFLSFEVRFEALGGPIWLHVRGPQGAKDFIRGEADSAVARRGPEGPQ